jgi:GxxExxY protein
MSHGFARIFTNKPYDGGLDSVVMIPSASRLKHSELTDRIIGVFYDVYNELGYGFLEFTYTEAMVVALEEAGLTTVREAPVPVWFRGKKIGHYFADLLVDNAVLLELKAARDLEPAHEAQLLHYLRATEIEVGLLLNFGLRPQFRRLLFDNERKKIRENPCESVAEVSA